ncbi:MAG: helix-turn-helix domain-containing protein [Spirulina sp. SIO3F2]|nr:helix-turn-helix domain-containing protein [Spirulina sp. SIO3F2]
MNMKELRERVDKRPEQIAVELGVAVSTVHNWDQLRTVPRMTPAGIANVMRVYRCTLDELVEAEEAREAANVKS